MAGNPFSYLSGLAKSKGMPSGNGGARKWAGKMIGKFEKAGMNIPPAIMQKFQPRMKSGGAVRGDGLSRVKTKGRIC